MLAVIGLKEKDKILINAKKSCQSTLYLRGQYLDFLPKCLFQKPFIITLRFLDLSYNSFEDLPQELELLVNLEELYIHNNELRLIPEVICNLSKIRKLGLVHNKIETIPFSLGELSCLEWLNLSGNLLQIIPPFLLYLPKLLCLRVVRNPIENVPREIYIQGLEAIRKYFAVIVTSGSVAQKQPIEITEISCHDDDDDITGVSTDGDSGIDLFSSSFSECISKVQKSQNDEIQLVRGLTERLRIRQGIRKMNLEYLQKQDFKKNSRCITRPRRMSDISLDSTIKERQKRRLMSTSEYGSLSTFTEHMSVSPPQDEKDDVDEDSEDLSVCTDDDQSSISEFDTPLSRKRHITHGDICVIIPECNRSGHLQSEFFLEIVEDLAYQPTCMRGRQVVGSEILMLQPHGAKFFKSDPAIISLPYDVKVLSQDEIICLCSDTEFGEKPNWRAMEKESYRVFHSHVEIKAEHFSLFAVVAQKQYHSAQRLIKKGIGGTLIVDEVPGVEIRFPGTSLLYDIQASVKVFYADEPYDVDHSDPDAFGLAAPVIELGPHGCQFDPTSADLVTVRLPLPNGKEILDTYGDRQLTFWCSSTQENEPLHWQQFSPQNVHIDTENDELCTVCFSVEHFTFFKVLWDVVDAILYEAKLGASTFVPGVFQFYVSCEALMSESEDGVRFGLCICCTRFGISLEGIGNFPISVGKHPPKMISTGPLIIRLVSKLFQADEEAGQKELVHEEYFTGRQFVAQFVCRFTGDAVLFGSFGRVEIVQPTHGNTASNLLFSFNLYKPRDPEHYDSSMAWDVHLSRELAALVTIRTDRDMGDEVWEDLAKSLGYTQVEINKIASSDDPMTELVAKYKRRGGQPHEFIKAMYRIGQCKTSPHLSSSRSSASGLSFLSGPSEAETESKMCPCVNKNMRKRKIPEHISLEDTFSEIADKVLGKWKKLGRALKLNENKLIEIEHDYKQYGAYEQAYQMLLAWRENFPDYCNPNSLSDALCRIGLGYVARQCCMGKIAM